MALPKKLKNFNVFIEGGSFQNRAFELTLPTLARKVEEYRAAGMNIPIDIDLGMEKMELEFSIADFIAAELRSLFGLPDASGAGLRFAGATEGCDTNGVTGIEITVRGRITEISTDTAKAGEDNAGGKYKMSLTYYKEVVNGITTVEVDAINMIEKINGIDRMEAQREALGI